MPKTAQSPDPRHLIQHGLDFGGIDVYATGDHHVVGSVRRTGEELSIPVDWGVSGDLRFG